MYSTWKCIPLTQSCNDCKVDYSPCVNSKKTKIITPATNGGIDCTPTQNALPLTEFCNYVTVYPEPNYQGTGVIYYPSNSYNISELNNIISSIKVPPGLRATLYDDENWNWNGSTLVLTSDEPNLNNRGFDNIISSITIQSDDDCKVDYPVCKTWVNEKIITPATNGGIPCTPEQNALPLTKNCDNCLVNYSACINGIRNKIITPAYNGGIACTPSQNTLPLTKICNALCSLYSLCNFRFNYNFNYKPQRIELINKYPDLDISDNTFIPNFINNSENDIQEYPDIIIHSIKSEGYDMILYSLPNYKGTKMELIGKTSIECLDKPIRSAIIVPSPNGGFPCNQLTEKCRDYGGLFPWFLNKINTGIKLSELINKYPDLNISNNTYLGSIDYVSVTDTQTYPDIIIHSVKSEGYNMILYSLPNYTGTKMELTGKIIIEYLDKPMRSAIINTMY